MSGKKNNNRDGFSAFKCPECDSMKSSVIDSRHNRFGTRRRRLCERGHRYTTYEVADGRNEAGAMSQEILTKEETIREQDRIIGQLTRERDSARTEKENQAQAFARTIARWGIQNHRSFLNE